MRWSALLACALVACGGRETSVDAGCEADDCASDTHDASDEGADSVDVSFDTTPDVSLDTAPDISVDTAPDVNVDTAPDADDASGDASNDADAASGDADADTRDASENDAGPTPLSACTAVSSDMVPVPEASGSALVDAPGDGRVRILLAADSGNAGVALVIDQSGAQSVGLTLPLGSGAGDDIEGLERGPDGKIYGLTSAGQLRSWRLSDVEGGVMATLEDGPYAVSDDPAWACDPVGVNCGPNYEGLCLHPAPGPGQCAGWAASKALGELVCLVTADGRLVIDAARRIPITVPDQLSGCAFEPVPPYRLLVGANLYSGSALWEVIGPEEAPVVEPLALVGAANQETVIVLPDGSFQSFGDTQGAFGEESPRIVFACAP